jgi:transcriptional regulator with XRE-family HTH domain
MIEDVSRVEARAESLEDAHYDLMQDLISLRKRHKISQEVVAERMSVSQPTVASFERYDSNPTLATIRRYALAVGARIQNSVIDDCQEHAMQFERIVDNLQMKTQPTSRGRWGALRMKETVDSRS